MNKKILYFGTYGSEQYYNDTILASEKPYKVAQYSLESSLIKGFDEESVDIKIISVPLFSYFEKNKLFYFRKREKDHFDNTISYTCSINVPLLREIFYFFQGFFISFVFCVKNKEKAAIFSAFTYVPLALGIYLGAVFFKAVRIGLFCDLLLHISESYSSWKRMVIKPYLKLSSYLENSYDMYILVSKHMKEYVNKKNRPFIVVEGIFDSSKIELSKVEPNQRNGIIYSGTLNEKYGIKNIISILEYTDRKIEFLIYGDGDMKKSIVSKSQKDVRLKYKGFQKKSIIFNELQNSDILINLRNTEDEYTKFSFPSKILEYLAAGSPILTTKLSGVPDEYDQFLNYVSTVEEATEWIESYYSSSHIRSDALIKASKGREFVLKEKNPQMQVLNILRTIDRNFN